MFSSCFPCVFSCWIAWCFSFFSKNLGFQFPQSRLRNECFCRFSIFSMIGTMVSKKINMSSCTFFESLWRDKSNSVDTNSDNLFTQAVRLDNTSDKTQNLASFGFTGILNVSPLKSNSIDFYVGFFTPRFIMYETTYLEASFRLCTLSRAPQLLHYS